MKSMHLAVAAAAALLMATPAHAQRVNTGATGTFGQVQLRAGFMPDPHAVTVSAGGGIEAVSVDDDCFAGYIAQRPTFTLRYTSGDFPLYISATSDADTTLAVRAPNGEWLCNDDSNSLNPSVAWENPRSGRYQIWVGRFGAQNETAPAVLHISEIGPPDMQMTDLPDYSLDPPYGTIELAAGFLPDPHEVGIAAGGSINAAAIGEPGCVGFIARAPDLRLMWTAGSSGLPLIFSVASDSDTTLVVNDAMGNWHCDDDGGNVGLNPSITLSEPMSGQYDIWVGTYSEGELRDSVLNISEVSSQ